MTLSLAQVVDVDCVVSLTPLRFDMPSPMRYARGPAAILRRILYGWCDPAQVASPLLDIEGARVDDAFLMRLRADLERVARASDFVAGASVPIGWDGTTLAPYGRIVLVDGKTYALEVSLLSAPAAVLASTASALGGS